MSRILGSITIDAPPEHVWPVLTDFDHWTDWQTWFTAMKSHNASIQLGTKITFTNAVSPEDKPGTYNARITKWEPNQEFSWKGGPMPEMLGWILAGNHWFKLTSEDGGTKTRLDHGELIQGLLSVAVPATMLQKLTASLEKFNRDLKAKIENAQ